MVLGVFGQPTSDFLLYSYTTVAGARFGANVYTDDIQRTSIELQRLSLISLGLAVLIYGVLEPW